MPLVRMTNLHLEPGDGTLDELIAGVERGIYLETNKSWSIDDKRLNFQFGTQIAWEIIDGKLGRMLRDATYTGITPQFWGSLDAVAGRDAWRLHGLTNCGKGQPGQTAHVSHGAVARALPRRPGRRPRVSDALELAAPRARAAAADADEAEVVVQSERSGLARFAASTQHQPTLVDDTVVTRARRARRPRRRRGHEPDERRRPARGRRARRRCRRARSRRSRLPRPCRSRRLRRDVDGYDEETAALGPAEQARLAAAAIAATRRHAGLRLLHERHDRARGRVDDGPRGEPARRPTRRCSCSPRPRDFRLRDADVVGGRRSRSGGVRARGGGEGRADARRERARAGRLPRRARAVRARRAAPVLRLGLVRRARAARGAQLPRRPDRRAHLRREGLDRRRRARRAAACRRRSTSRASPKQRVPLVEDGVARGVVWDRRTAKRAGGDAQSTGHAPPVPLQAYGPLAVRALDGGRRRRLGRRARRGRRRRHLRHARALPRHRRPARGRVDGHDARRDVPHPRRQDRGAARQPPLHRRGAEHAGRRARAQPRA